MKVRAKQPNCLSSRPVLVCSGCHNYSTTGLMASTTEIYFSQCWRLEVQDQDAAKLDSKPFSFGSHTAAICVCSHGLSLASVREGRESRLPCVSKGASPINKGPES